MTNSKNLTSSKTKRFWTEKDTFTLKKLLAQRTPLPAISRQLKRTPKAIRRKCEELGISSATIYQSAANCTKPYFPRPRYPRNDT